MRKAFVFCFLFFITSCISKPYENLFKKNDEIPRSSISGIDGVYVINLDIRPEKWHRMEPLLYMNEIDHIRFPAIFGWDFSMETVMQFCARHLRMGALGCMLSHLSIYQDALSRNLNTIWVMEDDVEFLRDPHELTPLIEELNTLDPEWDILYTDLDFIKKDGSYTRCLALPKEKIIPYSLEYFVYRKNISPNIQLIRSRYGTASMIVSKRGMKKMIDYFTSDEDIRWPFDIELHLIKNLKQYGIINPVATNSNFDFNHSDTGKGIKNYYEINDQNIEYLEKRKALFENVLLEWNDIFK